MAGHWVHCRPLNQYSTVTHRTISSTHPQQRTLAIDGVVTHVGHTTLSHLESRDSDCSLWRSMVSPPQPSPPALAPPRAVRCTRCSLMTVSQNHPAVIEWRLLCITNSDESRCRTEVEHLDGWCEDDKLWINVTKMREIMWTLGAADPYHAHNYNDQWRSSCRNRGWPQAPGREPHQGPHLE